MRRQNASFICIAAVLVAIGLLLTAGGGWLLWLGGSPYYVAAGLGCVIAAWFYVKARPGGGLLVYLLVVAGTCLWALYEVGTDFWQLMPRVGGPIVLAVALVLHRLWTAGSRRVAAAASVAALLALILTVVALTRLPPITGGRGATAYAPAGADDWPAYGRSSLGERFSPAVQITPGNVGRLEVAWTSRTGDMPSPLFQGAHVFEATPIKIGDLLYICTPHSAVIALDAQTGRQRWRVNTRAGSADAPLLACRGVAHFQAPAGTRDCASRILHATTDGRMIALDALTGRRCQGFGNNGEISLKAGMGKVDPGLYYVTSPATVIDGVAIVGGWVWDGREVGEPSGVIRGFDAIDGRLLWAWDPGAENENPPPGVAYSRGSPNSWSVMSADPALGLVFVPMGNATPDHVGMHRSKADGRYSSSVVALDARTGRRRWSFQTVHHDVWDYDLGAQPVLFDMPMPGRAPVPALAQATKHGEIYILDRRTGRPLTPVQEKTVPRGSIPEEPYAPTQPFSVGFPSFSHLLSEQDMWGATPLDQLWCRIQFRSHDYEGKFTPPSLRGAIQQPGNFGAVDWGSVSIDVARQQMIVNSSNLPVTVRLIPRADADRNGHPGAGHGTYVVQKGTPYAADPMQFLSPIGFPCHAPPWGLISAIDLKTRKIAWQRPFGTSKDLAPLGIAIPGAFNLGGSVSTRGGVIFVAAAIDNYLRAIDSRSGRELWRGRLPAGGQAGVMTYTARNGRQYVVVAAGGHQLLGTKLGDYVIAFALPDRSKAQ